MSDNPLENMLQLPWIFTMDTNNRVSLYAIMPNGALVAVFEFPTPEAYKKFVDNAIEAYEKFIPRSVREAIELLENYREVIESHKIPPKDDGSGGIPAKVQ